MSKPPACDHTLQVSLLRDDPRDEPYPVVVCARCLRRWYGHEDRGERALIDSVFPAALRDALLIGSDARAIDLLRDEGWSKDHELKPNAMLSVSVRGQLLLSDQSAEITVRSPRPFMPSHLVVLAEHAHRFQIDDLRIGNRSVVIQAGAIPAAPLGVRAEIPTLKLSDQRLIETGVFDITCEGSHGLPPECGAFLWEPMKLGIDLVLAVTNISQTESEFRSWVMGRCVDPRVDDQTAMASLVSRLNPEQIQNLVARLNAYR